MRLATLSLVALMAVITLGSARHGSSTAACRSASASIDGLHVSGNRMVNRLGQTVYLHGVSRSGTEYACVENTGIFDGPSNAAFVRAMASWHINAVRPPSTRTVGLASPHTRLIRTSSALRIGESSCATSSC